MNIEERNNLFQIALIEHLGPSVLTGGNMSTYEIAETMFNAGCDALLAELSKEAAPVIASEQKPVAEYVGASVIQVIADYIEPGTKLFTSPPNTAEIEQRVAEACAKLAECDHPPETTSVVSEIIRSGKWREYL